MSFAKRGFVVLILFFLVFASLIFFYNKEITITGNVPLTGILKEETGQEVVLQTFDISFGLDSDIFYKFRDVSFWVEFVPELEGQSSVNLDYIVVDSNGNLVYFDSESFLISGETRIEKNFDNRKAHDIDLEDGEYAFSLVVSYGNIEEKFSEKFRMEKISRLLYSLKQLFDISLRLDSNIIKDSSELSGKVIFESFGEEPTPVNLTFFVYDSYDNELYKKEVSRVVETEDVVFFNFVDFNAGPGKYVLVLRTFYNVGVEDYFEQSFEIKDTVSIWPFLILAMFFFIGLYFIFKKKK